MKIRIILSIFFILTIFFNINADAKRQEFLDRTAPLVKFGYDYNTTRGFYQAVAFCRDNAPTGRIPTLYELLDIIRSNSFKSTASGVGFPFNSAFPKGTATNEVINIFTMTPGIMQFRPLSAAVYTNSPSSSGFMRLRLERDSSGNIKMIGMYNDTPISGNRNAPPLARTYGRAVCVK